MKRHGVRIRQARVEAGLTQEALAERLGLTVSSVSQYERGRINPRLSTLERIAHVTGKPMEWLLAEEPAPGGGRRVRPFRPLPNDRLQGIREELRSAVRQELRALAGPSAPDGSAAVPLYQTVPAGGFSEVLQHRQEDLVAVPASWLRGRAEVYCLRVHGRSMEPDLRDGDFIAVRRQEDAENGDIVVATVPGLAEAGEYTVKRLHRSGGCVELRSINPAFPHLRPEGPVRIEGKVVGLIRAL